VEESRDAATGVDIDAGSRMVELVAAKVIAAFGSEPVGVRGHLDLSWRGA
jgi:hypothetical protein